MGRSALLIKKESLQDTVTALEASREFANIAELCQAVADSDWGKSVKNSKMIIKGISPQKVYQSLGEHRIVFKTKPGKRGNVKGATVNRVSRKEKLSKKPEVKEWQRCMHKVADLPEVPDRIHNVVDKVAAGSFKHGVALACMNCQGFEGTAYKSCTSKTCPLLPLNLIIWPNRKESDLVEQAGFGFDKDEIGESVQPE